MGMQAPPEHSHVESLRIPEDLVSARAKLVYLYVAIHGEATIEDLCETLELKTGAALSITRTLSQRGHIDRSKGQLTVPDHS